MRKCQEGHNSISCLKTQSLHVHFMNSDLQQRMEAVLADALDQQEMSGASFLVMKDGKTLCRRGGRLCGQEGRQEDKM